MMFWYGSHLAFWQWTLMWVGMVAFWALVGWAIYALIRAATRDSWSGPQAGPPPGATPRRILEQRLARGEIDVDEFRRRREALDAAEQPLGSAR
jgi:putative membrane protein